MVVYLWGAPHLAASPALMLGGAGDLGELAKVAPKRCGLQAHQRRRQLAGGGGGGGCHGASWLGGWAALRVIDGWRSRPQEAAGRGSVQVGGAGAERAEERPRACRQHL